MYRRPPRSTRTDTLFPDTTLFRSDLRGGVGNVYSLGGCPAAPQLCFAVPIEQRGNLPGLNAPVAGIPAGQDGLNLSTEDFVATAGIRNLYTRDRAIFSAAKQYGVSIDKIGRAHV